MNNSNSQFKVMATNTLKGAVSGMLAGFILGIAIYFLILVVIKIEGQHNFTDFWPSIAFPTMLGTCFGTLIGSILGGILGLRASKK